MSKTVVSYCYRHFQNLRGDAFPMTPIHSHGNKLDDPISQKYITSLLTVHRRHTTCITYDTMLKLTVCHGAPYRVLSCTVENTRTEATVVQVAAANTFTYYSYETRTSNNARLGKEIPMLLTNLRVTVIMHSFINVKTQ